MNFILPPATPLGQSQAINADEPIITVEAGAGTGKTWVLSGRYARLLDEGIAPSEILTLTYTDAAASDMKNRILERVKGALKDYDESKLSDTWISTIHSFAGRLLRESGLALDIDPSADVITPQQEQEFWDGIKNAVEFANLRELARTYGNKILKKTAEALDKDELMTFAVNKWNSNRLSDLAKDAADLLASSGYTWEDMLEWAEDDEKLRAKSRGAIQKILKAEWSNVWENFKNFEIPETKSKNSSVANLNELLNWHEAHQTGNDEELKFFYDSIVIDKDKKITGSNAASFKALKEFLGMTLGDWRKKRPSLLKEISASFDKDFSAEELLMRRTLLNFCAVSWGMWDIMKRRRGLLSFSDMIIHASRAIEKKSVRKEFKHILVDEFQDTDPSQYNMIKALAENSETSLFAVGDPKQSIYRFRHADPKLFADLIKDSDRKIRLNESFRTRKSLLERINKMFASLWPDGIGKSEEMKKIKFNTLEAVSKYDNRDLGTMPDFKIILTRNGKDLTATRTILAEELAFNISKWVREGRTIWDKNAEKIRPVKFSDFTILSRSRIIFPNVEAALEKFNIPSIRDRSEDFFTRGEIGDVVCMLRAAADVNDSFSVMGWLMSPFSEIPESDVIDKIFMRACKKVELLELIKNNLPEAYARLEYLSLIGANEGPAGLLNIFNKNRRWLSCYREQDRLRVLRNFRLALSMSRAFQQSGTSSLTACAEWLTRAVRREIKIEEPKWHDENENAVRLTAVHSSKGLEYPVTIVFDTQKSKKIDNRPLIPSKDLGLVFSDVPDEFLTSEKPRLIFWEKALSAQGELDEEARLFYVATTRAQDSLIFCGMTDKDGEPYENSWTKFLLDNIDDEAKSKIKFAEDDPHIGSLENFEETNKDEADEDALVHLDIIHAKNSLRQFSASAFSLFEWCPVAWRRRYRQGLTLSWDLTERDFEDDGNFIGGADLGTLIHWILSRWPANENFEQELEYYLNDREMITRIPAQLRGTWRNKKNKAALAEWLMKFASSALGQELRNRKDVKREYKFMLRLNNQTALAGAIDALYENNLIDYKLTSVDNAPSGLYESQLDFYALVAHELTGYDEIKTTTAFLREGIFSERLCSNFDEIKARILRAAEVCATGKLEPRFEHCASCPFKKGCGFYREQN